VNERDVIESLRAWRRANGLSQGKLAARLGVSQAAVSRWEAGQDAPSLEVMGRIRSMIDPSTAASTAMEELFVREQAGLRILFDLDGARMLSVSRGYARLFPRFSRLIGARFAEKLVGETKVIYEDPALYSSIRLGEVGVMTGTTRRHIDHPADAAVKHHWTICFRKIGARVIGDVSFDLCDETVQTGLGKIIRVDDI